MVRHIFITSDWHCFHKNILIYDNRPFKDIDHMHEVLINNYNNSVRGVNDICYFLGDMGLTKGNDLGKVINRLNGKKILIMGNHDKSKGFMLDQGFYDVLNAGMITIGDYQVTMTHCPLRRIMRENATGQRDGEAWHGEYRHQRYSIPDWGQYHLHGHTHKTPKEKILDRQWDVGVRANNYTPVSLSQIESWIVNREKSKG